MSQKKEIYGGICLMLDNLKNNFASKKKKVVLHREWLDEKTYYNTG